MAFIVFPYAVSTLPASPLWAILFFFMVLIIGIDNMMASIETGTTAVIDSIPYLKQTKLRKILTSAGISAIFFSIGLLFCTNSGIYWVKLHILKSTVIITNHD